MDNGSACPKCGYVRTAADTAPFWQCPSCGIAIEKYRAQGAAVRSVTAALVSGPAGEEVPSRLPFERRLGGALLDLLTAAVFLGCWIAPAAWRPSLASELGLLMLMEFFVLHSSIFLVLGPGTGAAARLTVAFFVVLFYLPVAGAFAWWHGGWWPVLGFAWLLAGRVAAMLAGQGSEPFEAKRGRFYWGSAIGYYVVFAFLAVLLPMPKLGFHWRAQYVWDGFWNIPPQAVMAWGFLYFGALGVTRLLEKPQWIADTD